MVGNQPVRARRRGGVGRARRQPGHGYHLHGDPRSGGLAQRCRDFALARRPGWAIRSSPCRGCPPAISGGGSSGRSAPPPWTCAKWRRAASTAISIAAWMPTGPGITWAASWSAWKRAPRWRMPTAGTSSCAATAIAGPRSRRRPRSSSRNFCPLGCNRENSLTSLSRSAPIGGSWGRPRDTCDRERSPE